MVPTYFRRELRDRVLQRRLRLRAFVCLVCACLICVPDTLAVEFSLGVMPRESEAFSTPRCRGSCSGVSGILDRPPSRAMTAEQGSASGKTLMTNSKAELRAKALAKRDALSEKKRTAAAAKLGKRG